MIENNTNAYAAVFAAIAKGTIQSYRGLHIVSYDFRSSPSLIYWLEQQKDPVDILHFLKPEVRDEKIVRLKQERDKELRSRYLRRMQQQFHRIAAMI